MKKSTILLFFILMLTISIGKTQKLDSATTVALNNWIVKYNLSQPLTKKITPYLIREYQKYKQLDSLLVSSTQKDSIKHLINRASTDSINCILIANGYEAIGNSRFVNAIKHKQRLQLTKSQIDSLAAKNLTLDRLKHTFVPVSNDDHLDLNAYIEPNFKSIFTPAQYDTILSIELHQQAIGDAKRIWKEVKQKGLANGQDSTSNFNLVKAFCLRRLVEMKKHEDDIDKSILVGIMKNLLNNKPLILQQLDLLLNPNKAPTDSVLLTSYIYNKKVQKLAFKIQQELNSWKTRYKLDSTTLISIQPLIIIKETKNTWIDSIANVTAQKDSLLKINCTIYDDSIKTILLSKSIIIGNSRYINTLKYKSALQLSDSQVNAIAIAEMKLVQLDRSNKTKIPPTIINNDSIITKSLKAICSTAQYDTLLHIEKKKEAEQASSKNWADLKSHHLTNSLDSAATSIILNKYNLNWLVARKKADEDKTNQLLQQKADYAKHNKPIFLLQLDALLKSNNSHKPNAGNYVW